MNLFKQCTNKEIDLLKQAGIKVEDKDYTNDELKRCESQIADYIMNHSSKNNDISKLQNEYATIFRTINID